MTNVSSGHYADNFRPHDTFHTELLGFDFANGVYYYNVGEGPHRNWDDYKEFGFISAGQGVRWRDAMLGFTPGDVIAAYLKGKGYVGVGRVLERAQPIRHARIGGKAALKLRLRCKNMADNAESDERSEYVCPVAWTVALERDKAKFKRLSGIYTTTHVRASLDRQPRTLAFLEQSFGIAFRDLLAADN